MGRGLGAFFSGGGGPLSGTMFKKTSLGAAAQKSPPWGPSAPMEGVPFQCPPHLHARLGVPRGKHSLSN